MTTPSVILLRGGGDLASGVAVRLHRAGLRVVVAELPQPLAVRRRVAFAQAVFTGVAQVEEVVGRRGGNPEETVEVLSSGEIPVLVDPQLKASCTLNPVAIVDGRMQKQPPELGMGAAPLVIGLGPGFVAGENCHAAIETNRGHYLGRVLWSGAPEADTGVPGQVGRQGVSRVLRAPQEGIFEPFFEIGDHVEAGEAIARVGDSPITAQFPGVLRGLLYPGLRVWPGLKVGDLDARNDPSFCTLVSDKSLAVGGGVLEALLMRPDIRRRLWV